MGQPTGLRVDTRQHFPAWRAETSGSLPDGGSEGVGQTLRKSTEPCRESVCAEAAWWVTFQGLPSDKSVAPSSPCH